MTTDDEEKDIQKYIAELAQKGVRLSQTQVWVLIQTYDRHKTINELAKQRSISYEAMRMAIKELENLRLLDRTHAIGQEWYYICRFDISATADYTVRFKYKKQTLNVEQLFGFLNEARFIVRMPEFIATTISYLRSRSIQREENPEARLDPTPVEVRSFLLGCIAELEEFTTLLRSIADSRLLDNLKAHELMGETATSENSREAWKYKAALFNQWWKNKIFSVRGINSDLTPKEYAVWFYENFEVPQ